MCPSEGALSTQNAIFLLILEVLPIQWRIMTDYVPIQNIVDGRNPAPVDRLFIHIYPMLITLFIVFHLTYSYQLVQAFCPSKIAF